MQSEETNNDRYFLFHYNCWQHDYYQEPAVAIISAMLSSIQEDDSSGTEIEDSVKSGYKVVRKKLGEIAGLYLENKIGVNLVEWIKEIGDIRKEEKKAIFEFDKMFNFSQTIEKVRGNLQEIAEKRTLVLVVDELDRCIPSYAIKVLERLHHIFYGLTNVVVIMAIDRRQLEHSVEEMFGVREDGCSIDIEKYLKKFIDFSMTLDIGTLNTSFMDKYKFYTDKFVINDKGDLDKINNMLPIIFGGNDIDIRRQEKIVEKANIIHSLVCSELVDISVFIFEILYEVLKLSKTVNMKDIALIEKKGGGEPNELLALLQNIEKEAWQGTETVLGYEGEKIKKRILFNLYGKVFWYFANVFNADNNPFTDDRIKDQNLDECVDIVKKYCEFCEIVK